MSVDSSRIELRTRQETTRAAIEVALDGWVGASAIALTNSLARWKAGDAAMQIDLVRHRDALAASSREFIATDELNGGALNL